MKRAVEQINGREGETAALLSAPFGELRVACNRFRPTSSQAFGRFSLLFDSSEILLNKCYNLFEVKL